MHGVDIPFGIRDEVILPILEIVASRPIATVREILQESTANGKQGKNKSGIYTFRCHFHGGPDADISLFLKSCLWKGRPESVHYRYLAAQGVPTARCYGATVSGDGSEVVFLEVLPRIGFRRDEENEWKALLSLIACFNACTLSPEYQEYLHPYEQIGQIGEGMWISGLAARPRDGQITQTLGAISPMSPKELARLI